MLKTLCGYRVDSRLIRQTKKFGLKINLWVYVPHPISLPCCIFAMPSAHVESLWGHQHSRRSLTCTPQASVSEKGLDPDWMPVVTPLKHFLMSCAVPGLEFSLSSLFWGMSAVTYFP